MKRLLNLDSINPVNACLSKHSASLRSEEGGTVHEFAILLVFASILSLGAVTGVSGKVSMLIAPDFLTGSSTTQTASITGGRDDYGTKGEDQGKVEVSGGSNHEADRRSQPGAQQNTGI